MVWVGYWQGIGGFCISEFKKVGSLYIPRINIDEFLGRSRESKELELLLVEWSKLLEKCLEYGAKSFEEMIDIASTSPISPQDAHGALLLLFRQILENLDAVSILVRQRSSDPIKLLFRSMVEAYMYVEYILENDLSKMGLCYIFGTRKERERRAQVFDTSTQQGRDFAKALEEDKWIKSELLSGELSKTSKTSPSYLSIEKEWERTVKNRNRNRISWFELFDGPANIRDLAWKVNLPSLYEILYRQFSDFAHNGQVMANLIRESDSTASFISLRHPRDLQQMVVHSLSVFSFSMRTLLGFYSTELLMEFDVWYATEVSDAHTEIATREIIKIV